MDKRCTQCKKIKPEAEFSLQKGGRRGRASACKACHAARALPRSSLRNRQNTRRHWGFVIPDWTDAVFENAQKGKCAICDDTLKGGRYSHLDHDHISLRVRGMLCNRCNHGLGQFCDSPLLLEKAAVYLRRGGVRHLVGPMDLFDAAGA